MSKIALDDVASGYNLSRINTNFDKIALEFNNKILYRDNPIGEPNQMENSLDMNSSDILNVGDVAAQSLSIGGVQVVPSGVSSIDPSYVDAFIAKLANTSNTGLGDALVGVKRTLTGAIATTVHGYLQDQHINVKTDFAAVADGSTDDTIAIQLAIAAATISKRQIYFPAGVYKITAPVAINTTNLNIMGDGNGATVLKAVGNFAGIITVGALSGSLNFNRFSLVQNTTTTPCVAVAVLSGGGASINFYKTGFNGDITGDLVYSSGQNLSFEACTWGTYSANTWGLNLDTYNQNTSIIGGFAGGSGQFLRITNTVTPGTNRVEGTAIVGLRSTCTGATTIDIGNSSYTQITGCILDQAGTNVVYIHSGADIVKIEGGYLGLATSGGIDVRVDVTAGGGHYFGAGLHIYGGSVGLQIEASASAHVSNVMIDGVVFDNCANESLLLDSVAKCSITNCIDRSNPISGSRVIQNTHVGQGSYTWDNNHWSTNVSASFVGGVHKFGWETGNIGHNSGTVTSGGGATTLVITHGLLTTPTKIQVTPQSNVGAFYTNTLTSTQFTITWVTAGAMTWSWEASI